MRSNARKNRTAARPEIGMSRARSQEPRTEAETKGDMKTPILSFYPYTKPRTWQKVSQHFADSKFDTPCMTWASQPEEISSNVYKRGEVCGFLKIRRSREINRMANHPARWRNFGFILKGSCALALAICLSAGAYAQEQQDEQQDQQQGQQQGEQQQAQDSQHRPTYAPQDSDNPPYSQDRSAPAAPAPQLQPVPGTLTVPAATILVIRTNAYLSSDPTRIGA